MLHWPSNLRKLHWWLALFAFLPLGVVVTSGLLLQLKKHWAWVQPAEQRGTGTEPVLSLEAILAVLRKLPERNVRGWEDVRRLDVRPGRGLVKAWLADGYEVQIDLGTGAVLSEAYRRSDLIESLHDGSFFAGTASKLGLFLPAGVALLLLWASGLFLAWLPIRTRLRQRRAARKIPPRGRVQAN